MKVDATLPDGRKASVKLNLKPGSYIVLEGPQGAGKTTIRKALALAMGDDIGPIPEGASVTVSSGSDVITVTDKGGVKSRKFRLPVFKSSIFNAMVDSGKKSEDARCKDRVMAVYDLITVTDESGTGVIKKIFNDDEFSRKVIASVSETLGNRYSVSYLDFIKEVKKATQELAREAEKKSESLTATISFWVNKIKSDDILEHVTASAIESAISSLGELPDLDTIREGKKDIHNQIYKLEFRRDETKKIAQEIGDSAYSQEDVNRLVEDVKEVKSELLDVNSKIDELKAIKAKLEQSQEVLKERGRIAVKYVESVGKIGSVEDLSKQIRELKRELNKMEDDESGAEKLSTLISAKKEMGDCISERESLDKFSTVARDLLKSGLVSNLDLDSFGINGVVIDDGDVAIVEGSGEIKHLDKMSEGEQVKAAFHIMSRVSKGKAIFPDRKLMSALQPANMDIVLQEVRDRKLIAITEAPTDGDLSVSVYEPGQKGAK